MCFSGGVDSTYLLAVCQELLGDRSLAVTVSSPTLPANELTEAAELANRIGARHQVLALDELEDPDFVANSPQRCYHCKRLRCTELTELAQRHDLRWIVDGANADDAADFRPGARAALEAGVRSPLQEAGLSKADIRDLSGRRHLPTADKPSAACLASRIPYGSPITREKLAQVERAEAFLRAHGFAQVRVRHHDTIARIEVAPQDIQRLVQTTLASEVGAELRRLGFAYAALDLQGYRSGSLNEPLQAMAGIELST